MNQYLLAAAYCVPIALACLIGGWLPRVLRVSHTRMQMAVSFVAGLILGVGLLHLLPHALDESDSPDAIMGWTMLGFLGMFFVARFLHFHHHDAPEESPAEAAAQEHAHDHDHSHDHAHAHDHGACDQHPHHADEFGLHVHASTWIGTAFGMTLHSLIDGIALAGAVAAEWDHAPFLAGAGVFLAVLLHKPFDSLTISMLMDSAKCSHGKRRAINLLYAAVVPVGVALYFLGERGLGAQIMVPTLSLAAGAFICIASSDLLPELQFHTHDRTKLTVALLLGIALAWGIVFLESSGHGQKQHDQDHKTETHQHDGHAH